MDVRSYVTRGETALEIHIMCPPEGVEPSGAAMLAFHGGGWQDGAPALWHTISEELARVGVMCFSAEYRLIAGQGEQDVRNCVADACEAVRWVRKNAEPYGIDPHRLIAAGGSAGGHLAVATVLFPDVSHGEGDESEMGCKPDFLMLCNPVIDTSEEGYHPRFIQDYWEEISPLHQLKNYDGIFPPTVSFHGTGDTVTPITGMQKFRDQVSEFQPVGALLLYEYEGRGHGFFNKGNIYEGENDFEDVIEGMKAFLRSHGCASDC